jgi:two-component system response regulator YesN
MLDWAALDVEIVGSAPNGAAALEAIAELRPDIVVADIRMPLLDGLGLVERCREAPDGGPAFIIVTAYADFDSLRRAMRGSVVDYLVKLELDGESLAAGVEKAKAAVRERRRLGLSSPSPSAPGDPFAETALARLLSGSCEDEARARSCLERSGFSSVGAGYRAALLAAEYANGERLSDEERLRAYCCAVDLFKQVVGREASVAVVPFDTYSFAALVSARGPAAAGAPRYAEILERALDVIEKYFGVLLRAGLGSERGEALGAADSFREASLAARAASGERRIVAFEDLGGAPGAAAAAAARAAIPPPGRNPLVAGVRDYVLENYQLKLSLADVAKRFEVSPNHLSTLFKRYAGVGYADFVARVKVEKAKELISEGRYKMFEVAQLVGFEDAFYFSKVFKRVSGVSPRDYYLGRSDREPRRDPPPPPGRGA